MGVTIDLVSLYVSPGPGSRNSERGFTLATSSSLGPRRTGPSSHGEGSDILLPKGLLRLRLPLLPFSDSLFLVSSPTGAVGTRVSPWSSGSVSPQKSVSVPLTPVEQLRLGTQRRISTFNFTFRTFFTRSKGGFRDQLLLGIPGDFVLVLP